MGLGLNDDALAFNLAAVAAAAAAAALAALLFGVTLAVAGGCPTEALAGLDPFEVLFGVGVACRDCLLLPLNGGIA